MSIKKFMDTVFDCFEICTSYLIRTFRYLKGLSFRSKAHVDLQLKSKKHFNPVFRCGFNCDKEIKILPLIYVFIGALVFLSAMFSSKKKNN